MKVLIFTLLIATAAFGQEHWVATWGAAEQAVTAGARGASGTGIVPAAPGDPARRYPIPPTLVGIDNQTIRMVVRSSMGGSRFRVRLSNAAGGAAVSLGAAHIALREKDSSIVAGSDRAVTFSGKGTATIYAGEVLVSDPVNLNIAPLSDVAVSLYFPKQTSTATNHRFSLHDTYVSKEGDFTGAASISDPMGVVQSYYYLAGLDVVAPANAGTVVTFGDSITDGDQSSNNTNSAWPAVLAARLQKNKATAHLAVVNAGISGNRILGDNGGGLARMFHDALNQPGVKWVTLLEGINDITAGTRSGAPGNFSADDLISAYRQTIAMAHDMGVKIAGCTLTPFKGSSAFNDRGEEIRSAVNKFIRSGGEFDAVIDFDAAVRDSQDPLQYGKEADSPDHLHPGDAGYRIMGDSIPLTIFSSR